MMLVTHALGIVGDAGSAWAELRFGELKAMIALALGEFENAKTHTEWLLHFAPLSTERRRWYLSLDNLLQFKKNKNCNQFKILLSYHKTIK